MKNIHVLPTDKPSRLFKTKSVLVFDRVKKVYSENFKEWGEYINQNIYITSDEEIKEGDWFYDLDTKYVKVKQSWENSHLGFNGKKIILTTDQDLIKDGVWGIEDGFLEWFVKNPTCEYVELKGYAIILPGESCDCDTKCDACKEEETKQEGCCTPVGQLKRYVDCKGCDKKPKQETLEEAGVIAAGLCEHLEAREQAFFIAGFQECIKWQQKRMYSEMDIVLILSKFRDMKMIAFSEWFEEFKNK